MTDGWCVWVTGLPGSGKSVISEAFISLLKAKGVRAELLSSDALRKVMTPKPSYTLEERDSVYDTLVYVAELLVRNGVNVVIDATGNSRRYRENARKLVPCFIEVYLECPLNVCMEREATRDRSYHAPRGIYSKAKEGRAPTVPGVGQPYEKAEHPEVTIDTTKTTQEEAAAKIFKALRTKCSVHRT
jgi:adenylylsulfate kinase